MTSPDYTHRLERLLKICRDLPANLHSEKLPGALVTSAAELLDSEMCSILLYDRDNHCLRFLAAPPDQLATLKNLAVPVNRSIAGWAFTHARPVKLNQADDDERIFRAVDREVSDQTRSLLAVPLIYQGETIGVFEAVNKRGAAQFSDEDVFLLETLAAQTALAIQSRRLLDETRQEQRRIQEMEKTKSDWVVILAEELRQSLGIVIGHAAMLSGEVTGEQRADVDAILQASGRLKQVADQLVNMEQFDRAMGEINLARVNATQLVEEVVRPFQDYAATHSIVLTSDTPEKLLFDGDSAKIALALRNLVENALVYTNDEGWVRVRAEALPGFVKFTVIDRGIGISEADQAHVFERFFRARGAARRHQGLGLGLPIARDMVEMHGGEIWVESEDGQGSTFAFLIPQREV